MVRTSIIISPTEIPNYYGYVYLTTCISTGKMYIGQHKGNFTLSYLGSGKITLQAIAKYGRANFIVKPIDYARCKEELNQKEIAWIEFFDALENPNFYNLAPGGFGGDNPGIHSVDRRGKNNPRYGQHCTSQTKQLISQALTGKMSGKNNPFYGHKHSDDTKRKMCGRKVSEEQKKRMPRLWKPGHIPWNKGQTMSEDVRRRCRGPRPQIRGDKNPNYGHHWTPEQKARLSTIRKSQPSSCCISVLRLSLQGVILKEYPSLKSTTEDGYRPDGVSTACKSHKLYKGSYWKYKSERG